MIQIIDILNMFVDSDTRLEKYIKAKLPKGEVFNWEAGFGIFNK